MSNYQIIYVSNNNVFNNSTLPGGMWSGDHNGAFSGKSVGGGRESEWASSVAYCVASAERNNTRLNRSDLRLIGCLYPGPPTTSRRLPRTRSFLSYACWDAPPRGRGLSWLADLGLRHRVRCPSWWTFVDLHLWRLLHLFSCELGACTKHEWLKWWFHHLRHYSSFPLLNAW